MTQLVIREREGNRERKEGVGGGGAEKKGREGKNKEKRREETFAALSGSCDEHDRPAVTTSGAV